MCNHARILKMSTKKDVLPETSKKGSDKRSAESLTDTKPVKKLKKSESGDRKPDGHSSESIDFLERISICRTDVCESIDKFKFNKKRVRVLTKQEDFSESSNGVVYWMSRDQRVQDNWALLYAQRLALKLEAPLHVCFCLVPAFLEANIRHFGFMLKGLAGIEKECRELGIPFHLLQGQAKTVLPQFVKDNNIGGVVTDFSPLRVPTQWVQDLKDALPKDVPLCQVDAHNIVPCWEASDKQEYGARTIRTKIHKQLPSYLTEFPPVSKHLHVPHKMPKETDWLAVEASLSCDRSVPEVTWAEPGTDAGHRMLESFCEKRLKIFASSRNDPNKEALSNLSPWIHFGQVSVQRCILMVKKYRSRAQEGTEAFIEEAIIRRELADNFCFYNHDNYDSIKGAYPWAQETLKIHSKDKRTHLYSREKLEGAKTHDDLWNAAQNQLAVEGKMHGFLRMYWAKKILEWTDSPETALRDAIYLNDKYSLDGRDPNGYVGCMWSIAGIHDQGWGERDIFGKIRFMNYKGCLRKFDVPRFVARYKGKSIKK